MGLRVCDNLKNISCIIDLADKISLSIQIKNKNPNIITQIDNLPSDWQQSLNGNM